MRFPFAPNTAARARRRAGGGKRVLLRALRVLVRLEERLAEAVVDVLLLVLVVHARRVPGRLVGLVGHRREHALVQLVLPACLAGGNEAGVLTGPHDDDVLRREDRHALAEQPGEVVEVGRQFGEVAAVLDPTVRHRRADARRARVQPDQPAVAAVRLRGLDRAPDVFTREQPLAPPHAAAPEEIAEPAVVVGRHVDAVEAADVAGLVARPGPRPLLDPERRHQLALAEGHHVLAGRSADDLGEQRDRALRVLEVGARRLDGLERERVPDPVRHREDVVVAEAVPLEARGHREQVVDGDLAVRLVGLRDERADRVVGRHQPERHRPPEDHRGDGLRHRPALVAGVAVLVRQPVLADQAAVAVDADRRRLLRRPVVDRVLQLRRIHVGLGRRRALPVLARRGAGLGGVRARREGEHQQERRDRRNAEEGHRPNERTSGAVLA